MPKEEKPVHKKKMVVVEEEMPTESTPDVVEEETKVETPSVVVEEPAVDTQVEPIPASQPVEIVEPMYDEPRTNYLFIIIPVALLVGALVGGLITYFSGLSRMSDANVLPSPVPTVLVVEPEATPVASSAPALKRDELKVQILNGSGVSGAAGKAKTLLEGLGYKNIEVGNASVSDLAQTEIAIKDTKKEYLSMVISDLAKSYEAVEASKPLVATSKFDLVITIGKK